ncbi:alpha/beta hydrolase [Asaia sp. W19]|uniref:alpha/beta fold hydrolase n=1 Tax=unclassified Asaia TaxID=2685023 RepID=UPI000F8EB05E|nr:alpha/beta fold hydrolase [Asaia sp. W19]RUT25702.1 alpha/beta hydrolase [Asaia sp. W19]RUT25861.1 alpha/beta hydrolase [Asaia sp. W19]
MPKTLVLPGAAGSATFWRPVASHAGLEGLFFAWPGLGHEPPQGDIRSIDDLVDTVGAHITEPVDIVAQSMGGFIALRLALAFPHLVRRLVLTTTSGGVPVADLGGCPWRDDYARTFPNAALWIADPVSDLSARLPAVTQPLTCSA